MCTEVPLKVPKLQTSWIANKMLSGQDDSTTKSTAERKFRSKLNASRACQWLRGFRPTATLKKLSSERPSNSSVEKPWSFSSPHVKICEKLRQTNLESNNSIILMFHVVLCCPYLEIYCIISEKKRDFWASEVAKDLDTTWHNQNMSIRMYPHVGFNVKRHIEPKPHGIL